MNSKSLNCLLQESEVLQKNRIEKVIVNPLLNPAFEVDRSFTIPPIKLEGIETSIAGKLIEEFKKVIPDFIRNTFILPEPIPDFEKYSLHFVKEYNYDLRKYLNIFKVHLKYEGGGDTIMSPEKPDKYFPGYHTNKIYYGNVIIPVEEIIKKDNEIISFKPCLYTQGIKEIETSDSRFLGSEIFDQQDFSDINKKLINTFYSSQEQFTPVADYYPLKFDYSTVALNLLYPDEKTIDRYLPVFDKITRIILQNEKKDILSTEDDERIKSFFSLYRFERKVNKNSDIFWEVTA